MHVTDSRDLCSISCLPLDWIIIFSYPWPYHPTSSSSHCQFNHRHLHCHHQVKQVCLDYFKSCQCWVPASAHLRLCSFHVILSCAINDKSGFNQIETFSSRLNPLIGPITWSIWQAWSHLVSVLWQESLTNFEKSFIETKQLTSFPPLIRSMTWIMVTVDQRPTTMVSYMLHATINQL